MRCAMTFKYFPWKATGFRRAGPRLDWSKKARQNITEFRVLAASIEFEPRASPYLIRMHYLVKKC